MDIARTVTTHHSIDQVFAYLADFRTAAEWDPATERMERESGDGGVGTVYAGTGTFNGKPMEMRLVVTKLVPNARLELRGENKGVVFEDTIACQSVPDGGTNVTYSSHVSGNGLVRLVIPFLRTSFTRLFDEGAAGLKRALDNLPEKSA